MAPQSSQSSRLIRPGEIRLLKKEIEAQGDFLNQERLERVTEVDQLKIEIEAIKESLREVFPDFLDIFERSYGKILQTYNPEARDSQINASPQNPNLIKTNRKTG